MADPVTYYVGTAAAGLADGSSWPNRLGSIGAAEAKALNPDDRVYIGPGTYRETLAIAHSGGSAYSTGTVDVTNGSKVVVGHGTLWLANLIPGGGVAGDPSSGGRQFMIPYLLLNADGIAVVGTNQLTSVVGGFQANMVGRAIQVTTVGSYFISAVDSANSVHVVNPDGSAPVFAGAAGLTFSVEGESPYEIDHVDTDTQLTLKQPWGAATFTGLVYKTWADIKLIGDFTGENTDGIGGVVRITGLNADEVTIARSNCITAGAFNYRTFRGIMFDNTNSAIISTNGTGQIGWVIEDCNAQGNNANVVVFSLTGTSGASMMFNTVRRCAFMGARSAAILIQDSVVVDDAFNFFENLLFLGCNRGVQFVRVGSNCIRNLLALGVANPVQGSTASPATGQATIVRNSSFNFASATAIAALALGDIIEDYNNFYADVADRSLVTAGANSTNHPPLYQPLPLRGDGYVDWWTPFSLLPASTLRDVAGIQLSATTDLFGAPRPQNPVPDIGPIESPPVTVRNSPQAREFTGTCLQISGRGYVDIVIDVQTGLTYNTSVYVKWDDNANMGVKPSLAIVDAFGVADVVAQAIGDGSAYELLTVAFSPIVQGDGKGSMVARLYNNTTFAGTTTLVYFDDFSHVSV